MSASTNKPRAWLCELAMEDGSVRTQLVEEDPAGLNFNDAGDPSPFRVTPLFDHSDRAPSPVFVVEYGAIDLPMWHESRLTCADVFGSHEEALAFADDCEYKARVLLAFDVTDGWPA